ncbi:hypothetical protein DXG01_006021 [Tephrocybe rancida]|nr:hypothetical protein DXG01_006021 [Tephrocybe rancida]
MGNAMGEPSADGEGVTHEPQLFSLVDGKDNLRESPSETATQTEFPSSINHSKQQEIQSALTLALQEDSTSKFNPVEGQDLKPSAQADTSLPLAPSNSSFPLSDSELPETFDASFSLAEMSDFFANPSKFEQDTSNQAQRRLATSTHTNVEIHHNHHAQGHEETLIDSIDQELATAASQFSQLESTVANILSSPAPTHPAALLRDLPSSVQGGSVQSELKVIVFSPAEEPSPSDEEFLTSATARIPEDLPRLVTTYADATNLAMKYPELAEEILTHPIPKSSQPSSSTRVVRPLSPGLHHPDRPNWAAAPMETLNTQPNSGTSNNDECAAYVSAKKSRRQRGSRSGTEYASRGGRRDDHGFFRDPRSRRHEPPPHHRGIPEYNHPAHSIPLIERISEPSNAGASASAGGDDTGTSWLPQIQDHSWGPAAAIESDAPSSMPPFGHSDVDADHEVPNEWEIPDEWTLPAAPSWSSVPNATNAPDDIYQQVPPSHSGLDRLGRHIISPRTIDSSPEQQRKIHRQARKQQVSDLNMVARRYLSGGSDRGSRRASSSASSNRGVEVNGMVNVVPTPPLNLNKHRRLENAGESLEERFHRLSCSGSQHNILSHDGPTTDTTLTPKLRSDEYPFRNTQLRTINSPHAASQILFSHSSNSKLQMSMASIQTQENSSTSNAFSDPADEWLPIQHSVDDWLPAETPDQHRLAPFRVLHPADMSDTYAPSKPIANSNSHQIALNANPSYSSGSDPNTNRSMWFGEPPVQVSSNNIFGDGPGPEAKHGYAGRSRQNLPDQAEVFSHHLAETHLSPNLAGGGHGWRAGGRGVRSPSARYAQPRRDPYGPRITEAEHGVGEPMNSWRRARV